MILYVIQTSVINSSLLDLVPELLELDELEPESLFDNNCLSILCINLLRALVALLDDSSELSGLFEVSELEPDSLEPLDDSLELSELLELSDESMELELHM